MNTELDQTANEALRALIDNAASAKEFILAELPEVVQQLLLWKMWESIIYMLMPIAAAIATVVILKKTMAALIEVDGDPTIKTVPLVVASAISIVVSLVSMSLLNIDWLQIWLAPKVYLLEYAADLVK